MNTIHPSVNYTEHERVEDIKNETECYLGQRGNMVTISVFVLSISHRCCLYFITVRSLVLLLNQDQIWKIH